MAEEVPTPPDPEPHSNFRFAMYFVPVLAWVLFGILILRVLGKHYS